MGLPVWRAPSPEAKDAAKVDLTAPARSPIRRRSPFAGRRARPSRSPRSPRLFDHDFLVSAARVAQHEPITRPSSGRPRLPPPPVPESRNYSRRGDSARDAPSWDFDVEGLTRMRRERNFRSMYDTSVPSFGEVSRSSRQLPAFTPNFAPAAASRSARGDAAADGRRPSLRSRSPPRAYFRMTVDSPRMGEHTIAMDDGEDESSDNNAVGFPPLRRMGRRTIADGPLPSSSLRESWSPATTLDGLGDRERSISPVDDHWDTMLSTVAPDPLAPTAESSFASAAASASFSNSHPSSRAGSSNSNSASSSRTHLTVPSRRHSPPSELFMRACDTSDSDTASDTEEEDMDVRPDILSLRRGGGRGYGEEPPSRNPNRYSRGIRDRSREASAYVRSFYGSTREETHQPERPLNDQLDGPAEETSNVVEELQTLDQELRDARAILERLTRREDISDEFWASVGLSRPMADRVERIQQRERL